MSAGSGGSSFRSTVSSAPRGAGRSSLIAMRPPPTRRVSTTSAGWPSRRSLEPISKRVGSSLACSTTNAPSTPWGRPTRPTETYSGPGSVGNLEHVALVRPRPARPDDAAQGPRDPALLADHLADVVGRDMEPEDDGVLMRLRLDANGVGLVDQPTREPLEQLGQPHHAGAVSASADPPRAESLKPAASRPDRSDAASATDASSFDEPRD